MTQAIAFLSIQQPPYTGPFPVIKCSPKYYTVTVNGRQQTVSIDRLKPAFFEGAESPLLCPIATSPDTPPKRSTRLGRTVHFPDRLTYCVSCSQTLGGGVSCSQTLGGGCLVHKHWGGSTVVCERVVPVNTCLVCCNLMILCRVDLRYKLLVAVNICCVLVCLTINLS